MKPSEGVESSSFISAELSDWLRSLTRRGESQVLLKVADRLTFTAQFLRITSNTKHLTLRHQVHNNNKGDMMCVSIYCQNVKDWYDYWSMAVISKRWKLDMHTTGYVYTFLQHPGACVITQRNSAIFYYSFKANTDTHSNTRYTFKQKPTQPLTHLPTPTLANRMQTDKLTESCCGPKRAHEVSTLMVSNWAPFHLYEQTLDAAGPYGRFRTQIEISFIFN